MRATITHVIEVARNCRGCTSSTCPAALALRHGAARRTLRLLRGAGDERYLIAQAVYLLAASMCVSTQVRDGRPVKEDEATQGHEYLPGMPDTRGIPEYTYVPEERCDRPHTMRHLSRLATSTPSQHESVQHVSRGAISGLWDTLPHKEKRQDWGPHVLSEDRGHAFPAREKIVLVPGLNK
jgi:hypothetical protein